MSVEAIDRVETELMAAPGKRYVVLATTANRRNAPFHVGGLRQAEGIAAANFIFSAPEFLPEVIARFDGRVAAFLVDTEIKNALDDLEARAEELIRATPIVRIKPNDMTVTALDLWLALLVPSMSGLSVLIVGAGNIGAKIALLLAERGAEARLMGRDQDRLERVSAGLNAIKRGRGCITVADEVTPASGVGVILGCTPGTAAVTRAMVEDANPDALIIDVGNGTIFPDALDAARTRGMRIFCLSPEAGFIGWMAAFLHVTQQLQRMKTRVLPEGVTVVGPGVLGDYGDVLVDDPDSWARIIGVCDGHGDTLPQELAEPFLAQLRATT